MLLFSRVLECDLGPYFQETKPVILTGDLNVAHMPSDVYDGRSNKDRPKSAGFAPFEREVERELMFFHL